MTVQAKDDGSGLQAQSVTVHAPVRAVRGRVISSSRGIVTIAASTGAAITVHIPSGVIATDGGRKLAVPSLHTGSFVRIKGYGEMGGTIRATSITIMHPAVRTSATIVSTAGGVTIRTSTGERFQLQFGTNTEITGGTARYSLSRGDLGAGARVHVEGVVASNGALVVTSLDVRLRATTVRGKVAAVSATTLSVKVAGKQVRLRDLPEMEIWQGSHSLVLSDLVVGDDVSVYGFHLPHSTILARKITVHRRIATLDGVIASLTDDGFTVQAADGVHRVITSTETIQTSGNAPAVAQTVHVTGYLRGDDVLLATRIRIVSKP